MSRSVAVRRKWNKPVELAPDVPIIGTNGAKIREIVGETIRQCPKLILSVVYLPSLEELRAWRDEGVYDGVLIIYDTIKGYENGIIKDLHVEELVAIAKTFYNMMVYTTDVPLPSNNCLKRFRQINYMQGGLVIFHKSGKEIPYGNS